MLVPTLVMGTLALALLVLGYLRGYNEHLTGLRSTATMLLQILPILVCAFIVAGMVQAMLPRDLISRWVGAESGFRGLMIGSLAGGLAPGGPYVSLPVATGLWHSGAGIGTMVAFLTGWSLWAFSRLPLEVGILGWKLTLIRFASTCIFPPIAGWIAQTFFSSAAQLPGP
ncbi:MAG: permease [Fidelibacterota bacterium]|nr:MAG: permease [Candidatus Neomarinimicrobiota bacterium]